MSLSFRCPYDDCLEPISIPETKAERKARCPKCRRKFLTPKGPDLPASLPPEHLVACERCGKKYWQEKLDIGLCPACIDFETRAAHPGGRHEAFDQDDIPAGKKCVQCGRLYQPTDEDTGHCPHCAMRNLLDES
ncbi:MAG: hypothetical protein V2A58_00255 [Planctomycetota bacterium]